MASAEKTPPMNNEGAADFSNTEAKSPQEVAAFTLDRQLPSINATVQFLHNPLNPEHGVIYFGRPTFLDIAHDASVDTKLLATKLGELGLSASHGQFESQNGAIFYVRDQNPVKPKNTMFIDGFAITSSKPRFQLPLNRSTEFSVGRLQWSCLASNDGGVPTIKFSGLKVVEEGEQLTRSLEIIIPPPVGVMMFNSNHLKRFGFSESERKEYQAKLRISMIDGKYELTGNDAVLIPMSQQRETESQLIDGDQIALGPHRFGFIGPSLENNTLPRLLYLGRLKSS